MTIPDDVKPFTKDNMTKQDFMLLGNYLIKSKIEKFKKRVKSFLRIKQKQL